MTFCLAVNTNDQLTAQILATTTAATLTATKHKSIGLLNGQELIRRQLYGKTVSIIQFTMIIDDVYIADLYR